MRVNLFFTASRSAKLEEKIKGIDFIRLRASVRFKTATGWSDIYDAIVDTGAPLSLIPKFIWEKIQRTELADYSIGGLGRGGVAVKVAKVTCQLVDDLGHQTQEMEIHAYLVKREIKTRGVPLILGFKDLLARLTNHFDYRVKEAWVEE